MTATPDPTRPAADPDVVTLLAGLRQIRDDWSGLASDAEHYALYCRLDDALRGEQAAALAARGLLQGETVTDAVLAFVQHIATGPAANGALGRGQALYNEGLNPWLREQAHTWLADRNPVEDGGQR